MAWTTILILLASLWLGSTFYSLVRNYLSARKIGAPISILPWNNQNPIWMIVSVPLVPPLEKYLPASWYRALNMSTYGFEFRLKEDLFAKDKDTVVLVTSGPVEVSIRDPELASEVMRRLKDFPGTDIAGAIMGIFGPNLLISDGDDWTRQRKLVSPSFVKSCTIFNTRVSGTNPARRGSKIENMEVRETLLARCFGMCCLLCL